MFNSYKSLGARLPYRYAIGDHLYSSSERSKGSVTAIEFLLQDQIARSLLVFLMCSIGNAQHVQAALPPQASLDLFGSKSMRTTQESVVPDLKVYPGGRRLGSK